MSLALTQFCLAVLAVCFELLCNHNGCVTACFLMLRSAQNCFREIASAFSRRKMCFAFVCLHICFSLLAPGATALRLCAPTQDCFAVLSICCEFLCNRCGCFTACLHIKFWSAGLMIAFNSLCLLCWSCTFAWIAYNFNDYLLICFVMLNSGILYLRLRRFSLCLLWLAYPSQFLSAWP